MQRSPFSLLLAALLVAANPLQAENKPVAPAAAQPGEKPVEDPASQTLSPEYMKLLRDAGREFQRRNFDATLKILDQADAITLDTPVALNFRGAVYTEKKDYSQADELFKRALASAPTYFAAQFNRGEVLFLQKKYPEARDHFIKMLETFKGNELLEYKVSLSYLVEDNVAAATEWCDKIKFPSDSPAYYFAHAALDFKAGRKAEGIEWIASAERIFGPENILLFLESLADLGYVERPRLEDNRGGQSSAIKADAAPKPASTIRASAGAGSQP